MTSMTSSNRFLIYVWSMQFYRWTMRSQTEQEQWLTHFSGVLMIIYPPGNQAWLAGKSPKCAFKWENDRTNRYVLLPGLIARGQSKSEGTSKYHNFVGKTL